MNQGRLVVKHKGVLLNRSTALSCRPLFCEMVFDVPGAQAKIAHMRKIVCVLLNMLCDVNMHVRGELNKWLRSH